VTNMDCKTCKDLLWEHLDNQLNNDLTQQVDEHLANCPACRTELTSLAETTIQPLESALPLSNPAQSPELVAVQKEQQRLVLAALEQLTLEQRTVWVLYEFQELPYNEIGQILNIPLGTVKSRISAARSRLREILAPERL